MVIDNEAPMRGAPLGVSRPSRFKVRGGQRRLRILKRNLKCRKSTPAVYEQYNYYTDLKHRVVIDRTISHYHINNEVDAMDWLLEYTTEITHQIIRLRSDLTSFTSEVPELFQPMHQNTLTRLSTLKIIMHNVVDILDIVVLG